MSPAINQFFDINQLPPEEGVLFFGISMNRIGNRQSAEKCFEDLQYLDTKINKTKGIGMVMRYGDYLYFHSEEKAHVLRDRYKDLMLSHKNAFINILETKPEWTMKAFSFMTFGQVMLDNSKAFQDGFQRIYDLYKTDITFKTYVDFDCSRIQIDFDERNVLFILEEITTFYLASKGLLTFNNIFVQNNQSWILQGYPGKPLKSEMYLFQLNPLTLENPKNKYEYCYYDLDAKLLYDYRKTDINTFDFNE